MKVATVQYDVHHVTHRHFGRRCFGDDAEERDIMRSRVRSTGAIILSAASLCGVMVASPASAAEATSSASLPEGGKHCWYEVGSERSLCAGSEDLLAEKMYTTYGVVLDERPGEDLPDEVMAPARRVHQLVESGRLQRPGSDRAVQPLGSTYLLIKGYSEKNYKGYTVNWTKAMSFKPCGYAASYPYGQIAYMHNFNFNDKMRSYQVAEKCRLRVYKDSVFRGNIRGPYGNSGDLGILDREVSSMSLTY